MVVSVTRRVEQVSDGSRYKGHVEIGGVTFQYDLEFVVHISQLGDRKVINDVSAARALFRLALKRDGVELELTDDEYGVFFQLLVPFAVHFYNLPSTHANQGGLVGMALRGERDMRAFGISASVSVTNHASYELSPELCQMLGAPKFGCLFGDDSTPVAWEYWRQGPTDDGFVRMSEDELPFGLVWNRVGIGGETATEEGALGPIYLRRRTTDAVAGPNVSSPHV